MKAFLFVVGVQQLRRGDHDGKRVCVCFRAWDLRRGDYDGSRAKWRAGGHAFLVWSTSQMENYFNFLVQFGSNWDPI